jgi:hypothetical protein
MKSVIVFFLMILALYLMLYYTTAYFLARLRIFPKEWIWKDKVHIDTRYEIALRSSLERSYAYLPESTRRKQANIYLWAGLVVNDEALSNLSVTAERAMTLLRRHSPSA